MVTTARAVSRTRQRRTSFARRAPAATLLSLSLLLSAHQADATRDVTGQWSLNADSSRSNDSRYAIHMALLRGDATYHSRVLWWGPSLGQHNGDEWGWNPSSVPCDSFPGRSLTSIGMPYAGYDVFCSGHAPLGADGRLLVAGGIHPIIGNYGEKQSRVLRDTTGGAKKQWYDAGSMTEWRWYPTLTTLGSGNILATSGSRARHHRYFFGRLDGAIPTGGVQDSVYRFFPVPGGQWDRSVVPAPDPVNGRPTWREFHTATQLERLSNINGHVVLGGRDSLGNTLGDVWILLRDDSTLGADYAYKWKKHAHTFGTPPLARSHHTALRAHDESMLIYGGRNQSGNAFDGDVYRMHSTGAGSWQVVTLGGTPPANRFGHAAVFDRTTAHGQMLVFGGIGADSQTPSDPTTWQLRFTASDLTAGNWAPMTEVAADSGGLNRKPLPRFGHAMAWDPAGRTNSHVQKSGRVGFMFGGQLGTAAYSDTLWLMWLFADSTMGWEPRICGGPRPSARARCSLVLDDRQGKGATRLYLTGGDTGSGQADDSVYVLDPWDTTTGPPQWSKWASRGKTPSASAATLDHIETLARSAEVYSPGASGPGQWQPRLSNSTLLQRTYPPTFVVSGGSIAGHRVLAPALNNSTYWLDVATSGSGNAWTAQGALGFAPEAGVLYSPNKIMVAGGTPGNGSSAAVGTTKTLDASNLNNAWQTSGSMAARAYTNLVLLPNGKVLAVGGMDTENTDLVDPTRARTRPQIWDPATGTWTDTTVLERQPTMRNYHSTAVLLPDGRVLSGGGEFQSQRYLFNAFCPPYLFKSNSDLLAARPVLTSAPSAMTWGEPGTYTLCATDPASVTRACLIRPGATTHFFDQNQRYVPLTLTQASSPSRLLVAAPANAADAPPGNYMLFVTGSADGGDVPSIARWVSIGSAAAADSCDTVAPAAVSLSAAPCYGGSDSEYLLQWTAPADDGSLAASGRVSSYDIRQYGAPITDANWNLAEPIGGPAPGSPGASESMVVTVSGLTYIRMKSKDNQGSQQNWSGLSNQVVLNTNFCDGGGMFAGGGGGGGGGFSLKPGSGAAGAAASTLSPAEAAENSLLNGVPAGTKSRDHLRLGALNTASGGTFAIRVREAPDHAAVLDAARLLAVDHSADVTPYVVGGTIVLGTRQSAERVTASDGTDLTGTFAEGGSYALASGDALSIDLGPGGGASPLILAAHGWGALDCEVPDGAGGWRAASRGYPRTSPDELTLPAPASDVIRLVSRGSATLRFVGRLLAAAEDPIVDPVALVSATDSRDGDVTALVYDSDSAASTLVGPDTLTLVYSTPPPAPGLVRDYFLTVDATPLDPNRQASLMRQAPTTPLPARFALRQNRPNPFAYATSIRFELPVGALVRLEVFDAQGRKVSTLANHYYPPGFHAVSWTPATSGARLGPGVYFCRIDAGSFHARSRMVLLP